MSDQPAPTCNCIRGITTTGCSWATFIRTLPPDDPVRVRDEANDDTQDWEDFRWTGEGCRCNCHEGES